jgi:hypothetical protein
MAGERVNPKRISFWAVVPEDEARRIAILLHRGQKNEALGLIGPGRDGYGANRYQATELLQAFIKHRCPDKTFLRGLASVRMGRVLLREAFRWRTCNFWLATPIHGPRASTTDGNAG